MCTSKAILEIQRYKPDVGSWFFGDSVIEGKSRIFCDMTFELTLHTTKMVPCIYVLRWIHYLLSCHSWKRMRSRYANVHLHDKFLFSYFIQSNNRACDLAQIFTADSDYRDSYARLIDIVRPTIDFLCDVHGIIIFFTFFFKTQS